MQQHEPELAKPGAGIPLLERLVAKYYFVGYQFPRLKWESAHKFFLGETANMVALLEPLSSEQASKKVLVPRLRGLEDSSRFWSPAMVVEHLVIVGTGMAQITTALTQGRQPGIEVDIAKVKPNTDMFKGRDGKSIARDFDTNMKALISVLGRDVKDRASKLKHHHPWFGPLSAHQWNWLMASHQRIHRTQLEHILGGA